jgi:hypothetical protein
MKTLWDKNLLLDTIKENIGEDRVLNCEGLPKYFRSHVDMLQRRVEMALVRVHYHIESRFLLITLTSYLHDPRSKQYPREEYMIACDN